jgi:succinyl-CoA synthetase beta subunit
MKIHEYQAKAILAKYDVPVPRGEVAYTVDEAEAAAKKIGGSVVVKAQIHAGGRGKGGGVKVAKDANEAAEIAKKILGIAPLASRFSWHHPQVGWRSKRSRRSRPS